MKKKLIVILAILLCVVLVFTLVACKKKNKTEDTTTTVIATEAQQADMKTKIESFLDSWLLTNAEETVTNQKKALAADLKKQESVFSFTASDNSSIKPTFNVSFKDGTYTVEVSWSKGAVKQTFTKAAKTVEYKNWAGQNSKPSDDWLLDSKASVTVDKLVEAGINTVNYVTGNAVTGKFGADGIIGVCVNGKDYAVRLKGNFDGTERTNNEWGVVLVDIKTGDELGGLYYKAEEAAQANKLYLQYSSTGDDGKLIRQNGKIVYNYKYINYADIFALFEGLLPETFPEANDGVLTFKDGDGAEMEIGGLSDLLTALDAGSASTIVNAVVNMLAKTYENDGRYYIDINLGYVMSQISEIMSTLTLNLDFLEDMGIDLANMHGLLGHITISAKINDDGIMSDFEFAVNIPKCDFYLTAEGVENELKFEIPAISFALFVQDFSFLKSGKVADVMPAAAELEKAVYFSPANVDLSGDLYIEHIEGTDTKLDDTFHFALMTDINPFNIGQARAALVIEQHDGDVAYEKGASGWTNFLSISYEQASKLICASGTAFKLEDGGNQVYSFAFDSNALSNIKKWLGLDNWQGIGFDRENGLYIDETDAHAKESAKALLQNKLASALTKYFAQKFLPAEEAASSEVAAAFDAGAIGDYFDAFKGLYDKFVESGKIDISLSDESAKIEVSKAMINEAIALINDTFDVEIDEVDDPEYVNVYFNYGETYANKCYITTKVAGNVFELTFDDSVEKTFSINFKMTTDTGRVYAFDFVAVKSNDGTTWTATVTFEIKNAAGATDQKTTVKLSNFHGKWGTDNSTKIVDLLPTDAEKAAAAPIFPADGTGLGTQLVKGIMWFLNQDKVEPAVEWLGKFVIRQILG